MSNETTIKAICPHCDSTSIAMVNAVAFYDGKGSWIVETFLGNPQIECAYCNETSPAPRYVKTGKA